MDRRGYHKHLKVVIKGLYQHARIVINTGEGLCVCVSAMLCGNGRKLNPGIKLALSTQCTLSTSFADDQVVIQKHRKRALVNNFPFEPYMQRI